MNNQFQKFQMSRIPFGLLRNLMLITTGGTMMIALIFGIGLWRTGSGFFRQLAAIFNMAQPAPQVDVRSVIVRQVKGASELTTAVFTMEAVVPASQARTLGGYPIATTTLLYIARGQVRAGVNLEELKTDNVKVVNNTIELQLPPPRILDSKIDVNHSQVYDYNRGFLGLGPDTAPQLQAIAQQETLKKIVSTACNEGVLKEANNRAQLAVSQLLSTAGYKNFEVKIQPPGVCQ